MPDGIAALATLGVSIPEDQAALLRGIHFIEENRSVAGDFPSAQSDGSAYDAASLSAQARR